MMKGPCEAAFQFTGQFSVQVVKCGKPGKLYKGFILPYGVILCPDCHRKMEAKYGG